MTESTQGPSNRPQQTSDANHVNQGAQDSREISDPATCPANRIQTASGRMLVIGSDRPGQAEIQAVQAQIGGRSNHTTQLPRHQRAPQVNEALRQATPLEPNDAYLVSISAAIGRGSRANNMTIEEAAEKLANTSMPLYRPISASEKMALRDRARESIRRWTSSSHEDADDRWNRLSRAQQVKALQLILRQLRQPRVEPGSSSQNAASPPEQEATPPGGAHAAQPGVPLGADIPPSAATQLDELQGAFRIRGRHVEDLEAIEKKLRDLMEILRERPADEIRKALVRYILENDPHPYENSHDVSDDSIMRAIYRQRDRERFASKLKPQHIEIAAAWESAQQLADEAFDQAYGYPTYGHL
jgi:hypothetical protein